jgi:hypothetical protein
MSKHYVILCTTQQIAEQLADLIDKPGEANPPIPENTLLNIDGGLVASLIKQDREQLIARNMLEKGHDRAAAERDVDLLQALVGYVREARLGLTPGNGAIQLDLEVRTTEK